MKVFLVFFFTAVIIAPYCLYAQEQQAADSLKLVLQQRTDLPDSLERTILYKIAAKDADPEEIIYYGGLLLEKSNLGEYPLYTARAYSLLGVAYRMQGNIKLSLISVS